MLESMGVRHILGKKQLGAQTRLGEKVAGLVVLERLHHRERGRRRREKKREHTVTEVTFTLSARAAAASATLARVRACSSPRDTLTTAHTLKPFVCRVKVEENASQGLQKVDRGFVQVKPRLPLLSSSRGCTHGF